MHFSTRQTSYLRIGPYLVLQLTLYLEDENVNWMSESILERVLLALKDRIPLKLNAELGEKGKDKAKIDVFRGADFQIAYFFRKMGQQHAVLLKDKQLIESEPIERVPPFVSVVSKKRARGPQEDDSAAEHMDLTNDVDDDKANGFKVSPPIGAEEIAVKDEEVEIPLDAYPEAAKAEEEDEKPDLKPTLKVKYTGYTIFNRSLIVIVEPYPALTPAQKTLYKKEPSKVTENRQLSASAAPGRYRESSSAIPLNRNRRGGGSSGNLLFRSETTPLGDEDEEERVREGREALRQGTRTMVVLDDDEEDEEDLPSLDDLLRRGRSKAG